MIPPAPPLKATPSPRTDKGNPMARTVLTSLAIAAALGAATTTTYAADNDDIQIGEWNHMLVVTAPAGDEAPKSVQRLLAQHVTVDFKDESLDQVVDFLRSVTHVNFVLAPDVLSAPPTISLTVADMPLSSVLHWVSTLGKVNLGWRDGAYFISSTAVPGPVTTTYYDVSDLVMDIPDFPGPDLSIPETGGKGVTFTQGLMNDTKSQTTTEDVADLLRKMLNHQQ